MRNQLRFMLGTVALVASAACSRSSQPELTDDLKQDLARVGGGDVQLAGTSSPRLEVVSAAERSEHAAPAPHAPAVTRVASTRRGTKAVVRSAKRVTPAPAQPVAEAEEIAPAEAPREEPAPEPVQSQARPRQAPMPSTQQEPRGGWKTPGQIIRNAPFPINP